MADPPHEGDKEEEPPAPRIVADNPSDRKSGCFPRFQSPSHEPTQTSSRAVTSGEQALERRPEAFADAHPPSSQQQSKMQSPGLQPWRKRREYTHLQLKGQSEGRSNDTQRANTSHSANPSEREKGSNIPQKSPVILLPDVVKDPDKLRELDRPIECRTALDDQQSPPVHGHAPDFQPVQHVQFGQQVQPQQHSQPLAVIAHRHPHHQWSDHGVPRQTSGDGQPVQGFVPPVLHHHQPPPPPLSHALFPAYIGYPPTVVHPMTHGSLSHGHSHASGQLHSHPTHHTLPIHLNPHGHQPPPSLIAHYVPSVTVPRLPYEYGHAIVHPMQHAFHQRSADLQASLVNNERGRVQAGMVSGQAIQHREPQHGNEETRKSDDSSVDPQKVPSLSGSPRGASKSCTPVAPVVSACPHVAGRNGISRVAYVNGVLVAAEDARVPVTDFGFSYGCAIVEEVLLSDGFIVRLDAHIEKLRTSAEALGLPIPLSANDLQTACERIVTTNRDGPRAALYIQLSFGAYGVRSRHLPPTRAIIPTLVIHSQPLLPLPPALAFHGIALFPIPDNRPTLSAPNEPSVPYISTSQLPELLALRAALKHDCEEAILFDPATEEVTGTTQGNIFCIKFGVVYTPPALGRVPNGVIRRCVLSTCKEQNIDVKELNMTMPFLSSAAEVFCISTLDQVLPVRAVGARKIGEGTSVPGPVTERVMAAMKRNNKMSARQGRLNIDRPASRSPPKRALNEPVEHGATRRPKPRPQESPGRDS